MVKWQVCRLRARHWIRLWWKTTAKDTLAPLIDTNARLQFIVLVVLIYMILPSRGYESWTEQLTNTWDVVQATLYALPVSFVLNGFFAVFKATKEERELGQWVGARFVYHSPRHLATIVVTDADNGKLIPFKIKGLDKGAGVEVRLERDRFDERNVRAQFMFDDGYPITWDEYDRSTMLAGVPEDEIFYITTLKQTPSNASTIKVYLLSWYG